MPTDPTAITPAAPAEATALETVSSPPDAELIQRTRQGDAAALGVLWRRHAEVGRRYARRLTSRFDADDVVAESFVKILRAIRNGHGPTDEFRPYLFTTIRNQVRAWAHASHEIPLDSIADVEAEDSDVSERVAHDLDASATIRAFHRMPARWQRVLWLVEIEGLTMAEVATLMGLTPNSVSSLVFRAREGLRDVWIQVQISDGGTHRECSWSREHIGALALHHLSARNQRRLTAHLTSCSACLSIANETLETVAALTATSERVPATARS